MNVIDYGDEADDDPMSTEILEEMCDGSQYHPYMSQPYSEAMSIFPEVTYTPCATSLREQTGDIIMFAQFEEGDILNKTRNNAESGDESDDNSIMPPLIREEEIDEMYSGDESDHDPISTEIIEYIPDRNQSHRSVNKR